MEWWSQHSPAIIFNSLYNLLSSFYISYWNFNIQKL